VTRTAAPTSTPRHYDSPLRRQQAIETRERIVVAGCRLLKRSPIRDWRALTVRGVAEQAGVNERTVYRHFGNERGLRDAVMQRLEQEAGIDLEGMRLADVPGIASRIFAHVSSYPMRPRVPLDPTLTDAHVRQRTALLGALDESTVRWPERDRRAAAALLDVLWSVASYERLVSDWDMDHDHAVRTLTWAIDLVRRTVENGQRPRS
jgi:AcrR family transcriptional regulator